MSAESVRATRDGRKTQTRRVLSHRDADNCSFFACEEDMDGKTRPSDAVFRWSEKGHSGPGMYVSCGEYPEEGSVILHPRYLPGKRYYVKETWQSIGCGRNFGAELHYAADGHDPKKWDERDAHKVILDPCPDLDIKWRPTNFGPWHPSLFMPRWASRHVIEIDQVRVQRLQDITEEDVKAEGVYTWAEGDHTCDVREAYFAPAWNAINGRKFPWASNPWVWAITYHLVNP